MSVCRCARLIYSSYSKSHFNRLPPSTISFQPSLLPSCLPFPASQYFLDSCTHWFIQFPSPSFTLSILLSIHSFHHSFTFSCRHSYGARCGGKPLVTVNFLARTSPGAIGDSKMFAPTCLGAVGNRERLVTVIFLPPPRPKPLVTVKFWPSPASKRLVIIKFLPPPRPEPSATVKFCPRLPRSDW